MLNMKSCVICCLALKCMKEFFKKKGIIYGYFINSGIFSSGKKSLRFNKHKMLSVWNTCLIIIKRKKTVYF